MLIAASGIQAAAGTLDPASIRGQAAHLEASLRSKFQSLVVPAASCGAAGDASTDDTATLQGCIATLPAWATLDGEGRTYLVSRVELKSRMRLANFRFVKYAGVENLTSPVTLDGRAEAKSDVLIENVTVEGQRAFEQQMTTPSAEDGGRHCFRIVGRVSSVVLANVVGNSCGTDGLQLGGHHATTSDQPEELALQNIVVRNAIFHWNRRVGIAFEGGHNLFFLDVATKYNGRTTSPMATRTSGAHCAHVDGACFGTGVWTENDHDAAGGSFDSIYFVGLTSTDNYTRAFYAFSNSGPRVTGFRAKSNLAILDSTLDSGAFPIAGNPMAVQFSSSSTDGAGAVYRGVTIANSTLRGTFAGRAIESVSLRDLTVTAPLLGFVEYFDDFEVIRVERSADFASSLWLRPDGSAGAVIRY